MKKKPKSNPKKPVKAAAKKPAPKKAAAKKPAAKKPAPKKPVKKVAPKKVKVAAKPTKKEVKKPVAKPVKAAAKKPVAKVVEKVAPKKVVPAAKPAPKVEAKVQQKGAKGAAKADPKVDAPKVPVAKPKRLPPPPKKRFVVLPPRPLVPSEIKDDGKIPKGLYKLEYIVTSSPDVLFEFLSTAGGLEKWFAPRVYLKENIFVFSWGNDELKQANLLALREREFVRFRWLDQADKKYFEFRLQIDDLTNEIALIVSDFADTKEELESARLLWNAQIHDLLHALGSP
ncbi:MAG TPA: START-like domain-containing protein [Bacteroidia bacterium]|jgi:hypothetical protein|nr:START-like domain-containing protein [Bacteroidia bacterium]